MEKPIAVYVGEPAYNYSELSAYIKEKYNIDISDINNEKAEYIRINDEWNNLHPNLREKYKNYRDWCKQNGYKPNYEIIDFMNYLIRIINMKNIAAFYVKDLGVNYVKLKPIFLEEFGEKLYININA